MKLNKIVLGLLLILAIVLIPEIATSKDTNDAETVLLTNKNLLVLNTQVDGDSTSAIIASAKELDNKLSSKTEQFTGKKPLYLFINSPGGSIQSGLELIEALRGIGRPIHTVTLFGASMAFQIAQNLNDRLILKNGIAMSHHAAGEMSGNFGGVHPSQLDNRLQLWLDRVRELDEQTVKRTNGKQTYESYTKEYDQELWMTGTKSVAEGYSDRIVMVKCDASLSGVATKHVNFMGFDISYDLDKCPINTSPTNVHLNGLNGPAINAELSEKIKSEFLSNFENKQRQVQPLVF